MPELCCGLRVPNASTVPGPKERPQDISSCWYYGHSFRLTACLLCARCEAYVTSNSPIKACKIGVSVPVLQTRTRRLRLAQGHQLGRADVGTNLRTARLQSHVVCTYTLTLTGRQGTASMYSIRQVNLRLIEVRWPQRIAQQVSGGLNDVSF